MGSYSIDELGYLHFTGDGWITTTRPLIFEEQEKWKKGELHFSDFDWK